MNKSKQVLSDDIEISSKVLNWSSYTSEEIGKWDVIVGADCLFFENFHNDLLRLLDDVLSSDGVALLFQPRRAGSMNRFIEKAVEKDFFIEIKEDYSLKVSVSVQKCFFLLFYLLFI
jgi:predicted nicotinamide N-methyase